MVGVVKRGLFVLCAGGGCGKGECGRSCGGNENPPNSFAISGNAVAIMVVSRAWRVNGRNMAKMILVRYTRRRFLAAFSSGVSGLFCVEPPS